MTRYTTRDEAIAREIIDPIEAGDASRDEFDIDAIADEVIIFIDGVQPDGTTRLDDQGYERRSTTTSGDEFWEAVQRHER